MEPGFNRIFSKRIWRAREYPFVCNPFEARPRMTSPCSYAAAINHFCAIDYADDATGEVVFAFAVHPGHLGGFAADEGATRQTAGPGKAGKELVEDARLQFFRADVVEEKKWARAQDGDVVHAMVHEIGPDGVVPIQGKRDLQFRADAVHARDEHRLAHAGKVRRKEAAEAADFAENFRTVRPFYAGLNAALYEVTEINVNAGEGVGFFLFPFCHSERQSRNKKANAYLRSANNVGCAASAARAFERPSRFSMMYLSSSGSTGRG